MIPEFDYKLWPHVDMNTIYIEKQNICYQGFVNLIDNNSTSDGGFVIWEMPIESSIKYVKKFPNNSNFSLVKAPNIIPTKIILPAGILFLWDSRIIHCNMPPTINSHNNRAVLYVCMVPKHLVSKEAIRKLQYFKKYKITSKHNPYYPEENS